MDIATRKVPDIQLSKDPDDGANDLRHDVLRFIIAATVANLKFHKFDDFNETNNLPAPGTWLILTGDPPARVVMHHGKYVAIYVGPCHHGSSLVKILDTTTDANGRLTDQIEVKNESIIGWYGPEGDD